MNRLTLLFPAALLLAAVGVRAQTMPEAHGGAAYTLDAQASVQSSSQSTRGDDRQSTIKTVRGEVTLVDGRTRRAAVEGGAVRQGEQIVTGADSSTAVTLRDGTVVSAGPNSAVELSQYHFEPTTEDGNIALSLIKGSLHVVTGQITHAAPKTDPARVKITTPTAVIGVRGTDVVVEVENKL